MNRSDSLVCNCDVCWVAGERTMTAEGQLHAPAPHTCPAARTHSLALRKQSGLPRTDSWPAYAHACVC